MIGGNTVGDQVRESTPRADGYRHVDTPLLIQKLESLHVNTYVYQVWDSPTDWQDLVTEFAPAAQAAGIQVWPYITPPTECYSQGKCSQPYQTDYVAWARAIAELSLNYPVVQNWAIDDFSAGGNPNTFTPAYMDKIKAATDAINPKVGLYTTAYYDGATSDAFLDRYKPYIAGIYFPYVDTVSNPYYGAQLTEQLDTVLAHTAPRHLNVLFMNYTGRQLGSTIDETPEDVTGLLDVVRPYVADGRLQGIISYATPMTDQPEISSQDKAKTGVGRLSLSDVGTTTPGDWAAGDQTVAVEPGLSKYTITFSHYDQWGSEVAGGLHGFYRKQLLIDGDVVWDSDVTDGRQNEYSTATVDITKEVTEKRTVLLAFRLMEAGGAAYSPTDVGIDDVSGSGITIRNGGFESDTDWNLTSNAAHVKPRIDIWSPNQPQRLFRALAREFSIMAGTAHVPIPPLLPQPPKNNRAMYGAGRLSLSLGYNANTTAGQCASATQHVSVVPGLARYELSFFQNDQWWGTFPGYQHKQVLIDGTPVYDVDLSDVPPNTWIEGQQLIGPVDVTNQVKGKQEVDLTFRLCDVQAVTFSYPVDVGFDNITTIGLDVANPGFDSAQGWTLTSQGNLKATIDLPSVQGDITPSVSQVFPGDSLTVEAGVSNRTQTQVNDVDVTLPLPQGWTATPVSPTHLDHLRPGDRFAASFKVTVPPDQDVSPAVTLQAQARYRGPGSGSVSRSVEVAVRSPIDITAARADPDYLSTPGGSTTMTVTLKNHLPTATQGHVTISGPSGWTIQPAGQTYQLGAAQQTDLTFTVTAPSDATQGAQFQIASTYNGAHAGATATADVYLQAVGWEFNHDGDAEGWQASNDLTRFTVAAGTLSTTSTGGDPFMVQSQPLSIDASHGLTLEVVMSSTAASTLQIYWGTANDPNFSETKSVVCQQPVTPGPMQTYHLIIPPQTSQLTALRVDPLMTTGALSIAAIRILM